MLEHLTHNDIQEVIGLAEAVNARGAGDVAHIDVRRMLQSDRERQQLLTKIKTLSPEALLELEALIWTGIGDGDRTFAGNLDYARHRKDPKTVAYIAGRSPALPGYLRDGLKKIVQK
jgi:hypothetical protein